MVVVVGLLVFIGWELRKISNRLKAKFPTDREQDFEWSQKDPVGHWEAHKNEHDQNKRG
jgi:hypothetical protein